MVPTIQYFEIGQIIWHPSTNPNQIAGGQLGDGPGEATSRESLRNGNATAGPGGGGASRVRSCDWIGASSGTDEAGGCQASVAQRSGAPNCARAMPSIGPAKPAETARSDGFERIGFLVPGTVYTIICKKLKLFYSK